MREDACGGPSWPGGFYMSDLVRSMPKPCRNDERQLVTNVQLSFGVYQSAWAVGMYISDLVAQTKKTSGLTVLETEAQDQSTVAHFLVGPVHLPRV